MRRVLSRFKLLGEQEVIVDTSFFDFSNEGLDHAIIEYPHPSAHWKEYHNLRPPERISSAKPESHPEPLCRLCAAVACDMCLWCCGAVESIAAILSPAAQQFSQVGPF